MNTNKSALLAIWEKFTLTPANESIDFFDAGGDSLGAVNMIVEVQQKLGIDISLEKFMLDPTLPFLFNTTAIKIT